LSGILGLGPKALTLLAGADKTFWMPAQRSTYAGAVDALFYTIFWICVLFFFLILAMAAFFLVKYRKRGDSVVTEKSAHHSTPLELIWSGIPLLIVLAIFVMGFRSYMDLVTPPENSYQIQVTGQKWNWEFAYPNGFVDSDLHVPVGRPVTLLMSSEDVIHSFFVPELRAKQDVVPGRYTKVWFEVDQPFEGTVFCAEYCGTNHSQMQSKFIAHEESEFDKWLQEAEGAIFQLPPHEAGAILYEKRGCKQCHSIDGVGGIGPTFLSAFGNRRQFADGSTGTMDENYIRESILEPRAKVVSGFDPVMPTFQGRIKDKELDALIAYIMSLK